MTDPFYKCLSCGAAIAMADFHGATDIVLCHTCGKTIPFSVIAPIPGSDYFDIRQLPKGVRIEENPIHGRSIIYRRVSPTMLFLIPFTALWSGSSMSLFYGTQIKSGQSNLFLSLCGLPFLIATVFLISKILFNVFGRWKIGFEQGELAATMEIGSNGWTRRLDCDESARVSIQTTKLLMNRGSQRVVQIESDDQRLKFGATIPEEAKAFIAESIRRILAEKQAAGSPKPPP